MVNEVVAVSQMLLLDFSFYDLVVNWKEDLNNYAYYLFFSF